MRKRDTRVGRICILKYERGCIRFGHVARQKIEGNGGELVAIRLERVRSDCEWNLSEDMHL